MINIKSKDEIELMRIAGHIVFESHKYIKPYIKEGITTEKLDKLVEEVSDELSHFWNESVLSWHTNP